MKNILALVLGIILIAGVAIAAETFDVGFAITVPVTNSTTLDGGTKAVYVGTAGNLVVDMYRGGTVTYNAVAGEVLPINIRAIYNTSTAGGLIGLK